MFWPVTPQEIYTTSNVLMHFYIKRDLLNKTGKGERHRQVSKVLGIHLSSCFGGVSFE